MKKKFNIGFTLIELLVVISIIGLLSTVAVYAINVARMKARDTKRIHDLKLISNALELFYDDNGYYPNGAYDSRPSYGADWSAFSAFLEPTYVAEVPIDPMNQKKDGLMCNGCGEYYYNGYGQSYIISTYLATEHEAKTDENQYGPFYSLTSNCMPSTFWVCN